MQVGIPVPCNLCEVKLDKILSGFTSHKQNLIKLTHKMQVGIPVACNLCEVKVDKILSGFTSHKWTKTKLNSVALVRERTIPTERPSPVGEVSANFCVKLDKIDS